MQIFKIRQNGFKEIQKQSLQRSIPIMVIAITAGISISIFNGKPDMEKLNVLPIIIPIVVIAAGFGMYRGLNRQKSIFESYTLTITDNLITREQLNTPAISLYLNEIKEIVKNKNNSFSIKGKNANDIIIPPQIESYEQLEQMLNKIKPLKPVTAVPLMERSPLITVLATILLMVCVFTVTNKIIVALSGSMLIAIIIWSYIKIRSSKNIDNKTKKGFRLIWIVMASIIFVMIIKLIGMPLPIHK
jgi:hypothetical protein